jgi:hypothetical protein
VSIKLLDISNCYRILYGINNIIPVTIHPDGRLVFNRNVEEDIAGENSPDKYIHIHHDFTGINTGDVSCCN